MTERKLFFPGIGGNRYEVSLEELRNMAYKGKVEREDALILRETKDGRTIEVEITCGKIKGMEEFFAKGEADRETEKKRQEEEAESKRIAAEIQRVIQEKERKALEKERQEKEKLLEDERQKRRQEENERLRKQEEENKRKAGEFALERATNAVQTISAIEVCGGTILGLAVFIGSLAMAADKSDGMCVFIGLMVVGVIALLTYLSYVALWLPIWLAQYIAETIKRTILDSTEQAETTEKDESEPESSEKRDEESKTPEGSKTVPVPPAKED